MFSKIVRAFKKFKNLRFQTGKRRAAINGFATPKLPYAVFILLLRSIVERLKLIAGNAQATRTQSSCGYMRRLSNI